MTTELVEPPPAYNPAQAVETQLLTHPASPNPNLSSLPPREFSFVLKNFLGKPFATLTLLAHPVLSGTTPTFLEGSDINGALKLNLRTSDPVSIGDLVVAGDPEERMNFFRLGKFIWKPSMGDPRAPVASGGNWTQKLKGEYDFPFSIKLPEFVSDPDGGRHEFRLPHSFTEPSSKISLLYSLELSINRGKFRSHDRITTSFGLFSMQAPSQSPSQLRQLALQSGGDAPGPYSDPDGWYALKPVRIQGILSGERPVSAKCTLCYTRTASIPCAMTIEVDSESESQVADVLASMKPSTVYLQRTVRCSLGHPTINRHLRGEIYLQQDLQPTTEINKFHVEYSVAVFPPAVFGSEHQPSTGPLATRSVDIVTQYASGAAQSVPTTAPTTESLERNPVAKSYYESVREATSGSKNCDGDNDVSPEQLRTAATTMLVYHHYGVA
ncbi:hypothetical protein R3P38DRAFT_2858803 [Favolaschia claudopus]|uniref:Arrestin-like N-terminal domain-containing protein n=1 Tax=Favolaschia claudopus TaxID=2862362 RepID=A0AAW0DM27_9AGAR